jgi:protein O-GlcNAc transferase
MRRPYCPVIMAGLLLRMELYPVSLQRFADAVRCWRSGHPAEAETLCRTIIAADRTEVDAHRLLAEILIASGRRAEAVAACRDVLELAPGDAANLRRLADLLSQAGDAAAAVNLLQRSLHLEPGNSRALNNLGNLLTGMGRTTEAIAVLERAIAAQPAYPIARNNLGNALSRAGRLDEAIEHYECALALRGDFPEALLNLGVALAKTGRLEEALRCHDRADALRPPSADALTERAQSLLLLTRPADALAAFDQAVALQPTLAKAHAGRGLALAAAGRGVEAIDAYARAAQLDPRDPSVFKEVGYLMVRLGRYANAHAAFSAALELQPEHIPALEGRVMTLLALNRHEEALPGLAALRVSAPGIDYLPGHLLHAQLHCCDWHEYHSARDAITASMRRGERVDMPLSFMAHNEWPADQLLCARMFVADKCSADSARLPWRPRLTSQRLRIAYLSSDFRDHPVAQLGAGVFESHARSRFEIFAFSTGLDDGSELRRRLERGFEHFEEVSAMQDHALAARMAELSIDIAVDLGGHTSGSRTRVLAFRPAPVQLAFLGFPGTSGTDYIDYVIADRHVIPESDLGHYSEQVIYLPDSYLPNDVASPVPPSPSRFEAGLPASGFIYCSFNAPYKLSPTLFDVWMSILKSVPDSVLWLRGPSEAAKQNLAKEAERRGVDSSRLIYAARVRTLAEHRARLALADVFLDTHPYNAHTTATDALGAGVPVITLRGRTFASRVATSLLHARGLGWLSVDSAQQYQDLAIEFARAPSVVAQLKAHLRCVASNAPLYEPQRFCRQLEAAYTEIWRRHQRGAPPATLTVDRALAELA